MFSNVSSNNKIENRYMVPHCAVHEKLEGKGEASFDIPLMIQSHAESMKKIVGPFRIYQLTSTANPAQFTQLWPDWLC